MLQNKDYYTGQGLDIWYETHVESIDLASREVTVRDSGQDPIDRLVLATGFEYEKPDIPGTGLKDIYERFSHAREASGGGAGNNRLRR